VIVITTKDKKKISTRRKTTEKNKLDRQNNCSRIINKQQDSTALIKNQFQQLLNSHIPSILKKYAVLKLKRTALLFEMQKGQLLGLETI
jgi:hypothetical protein